LGSAITMDTYQDLWPFDWSKVDIPGSPSLSRLFKALQTEFATHIPPLSLDTPGSDDPPCLSSLEIQELLNGSVKTGIESFHRARSSQAQTYFITLSAEKTSRSRHPQYPRWHSEDVFCGYVTSPLREIYVFPPSPPRKISRKPSHSRTHLWTHLQTLEIEHEIKFTKLKKQFPTDNPAIAAVMEDLADVFYKLDKYRKSESLDRELVDIYRRTLGPNHVKTLKACQKVVESLRAQGQFSKAKVLNDNLRSTISKLVHPHHPLAIRFAKTDAWLAEALGRGEDSERLRREILQITLASYGPRHHDGIRALSVLGHTISRRGRQEGVALLRTALQLSLEDPDDDDEASCWAMIDLASALDANGADEESYSIATRAIERYTPLLGPKYKRILNLEERRAWSMLKMGNLVESEKLFRDLVSIYSIEKVEANRRDLVNAWYGLANVLSETGHIKEATGWYEKSFHTRISSEEAIHSAAVSTGCKLAHCYETHGRFDDALNIYNQMIDKIRKSGKDQNRMIARLELEIIRIEEHLEQRTAFCTDIERGNIAHNSDSNDEGTDNRADSRQTADEELNDESDTVVGDDTETGMAEEEREEEKEDWKLFVHEDFPTP